MTKEHNYKNLTWTDLENPTDEEINQIMLQFDIPIDAAEDLLSPTPKQRVVMYKDCVYIVLHFPQLTTPNNRRTYDNRQEIDFIIGKNFLITVHYDSIRSIDKFSKSIKEEKVLDNDKNEENAGFIFHKLIKHLYHSLLNDVEIIKDNLHKAENSVFKGEEKKMVVRLSQIHRDILRFNNALVPHREAIATLSGMFRTFLGEQYDYFIHDMSSEYQRVDRRMGNNKDLLDELRHTNDSLLSSKQNEAMKGLTMMAFITFPLTLVAAIFSMKTSHTPIIGLSNDFEIIIGIMLAVVILIISFFAYKKWL